MPVKYFKINREESGERLMNRLSSELEGFGCTYDSGGGSSRIFRILCEQRRTVGYAYLDDSGLSVTFTEDFYKTPHFKKIEKKFGLEEVGTKVRV